MGIVKPNELVEIRDSIHITYSYRLVVIFEFPVVM